MKTEKLQRLIALNKSFTKKAETYRKIALKATDVALSNTYFKKYQRYISLYCRIHTLGYLLKYPYTISKPKDNWIARSDYDRRLDRKAEKKQEFLTKRKYQPWFLQTSLETDYGSNCCDNCGRKFYHSPSTITQATKEIYNCCCGHCTNQIIKQDWNQVPYH